MPRPLVAVLALAVACGGSAVSPREVERPEGPAPEPSPEQPVSHPVESNGAGAGCTAAVDAWIAESGGEMKNPPPEYDEELHKTLSRGTYLNPCSVSPSTDVKICCAVLEGTVRGVTVALDPGEQAQADCVAAAIERMTFSSQPMMALARTRFEPGD
jgi:hypothetical protein